MLLNKCYGSEEVEEDEMAGHATRMTDTLYIYSISVYHQNLAVLKQQVYLYIQSSLKMNFLIFMNYRYSEHMITYLVTYLLDGAASYLRNFPVLR